MNALQLLKARDDALSHAYTTGTAAQVVLDRGDGTGPPNTLVALKALVAMRGHLEEAVKMTKRLEETEIFTDQAVESLDEV